MAAATLPRDIAPAFTNIVGGMIRPFIRRSNKVEELTQIVAAALRVLNPEGDMLPTAIEEAEVGDPPGLETTETIFPAARHIPTTPPA